MRRSDSGMTLVEVLMATLILGICIVGLMGGLGSAVEVFNASAFVHQAANVLARGEAAYPFIVETDPEADLRVNRDDRLFEGWSFEREVDASDGDNEDGLYVVRTRVVKGRGGPGMEMEFVRLFYHSN